MSQNVILLQNLQQKLYDFLVICHQNGHKISANDILENFVNDEINENQLNVALNAMVENKEIFKQNGIYQVNVDNANISLKLKQLRITETQITTLISNVMSISDDNVNQFISEARLLNDRFSTKKYEIYYSQEIARNLFSKNNTDFNAPHFSNYEIVSMAEHHKKIINENNLDDFLIQYEINKKYKENLPKQNYLTDVTTLFKTRIGSIPLFLMVIEMKLKYQGYDARFLDILRLVIYLKFFNYVKYAVFILCNENAKNHDLPTHNVSICEFKNKITDIKTIIKQPIILNIFNDLDMNVIKESKNDLIYLTYETVMSIWNNILNTLNRMQNITKEIEIFKDVFPIRERHLTKSASLDFFCFDIIEIIVTRTKQDHENFKFSNGINNYSLIKNYINSVSSSENNKNLYDYLNNNTPKKVRYMILYCYIHNPEMFNNIKLIDKIVEEIKKNTEGNSFMDVELEKTISDDIKNINQKIMETLTKKELENLYYSILEEMNTYLNEVSNSEVLMDNVQKRLKIYNELENEKNDLIRSSIKLMITIDVKNQFINDNINKVIIPLESNLSKNRNAFDLLLKLSGFSGNYKYFPIQFFNDYLHSEIITFLRKQYDCKIKNIFEIDFTGIAHEKSFLYEILKKMKIIINTFHFISTRDITLDGLSYDRNNILTNIKQVVEEMNAYIENEYLKELKSK